jgi:uncharacterized MAPEG superfamily protein
MNTDLLYLAAVAAFTGLLWLPYIVDRIVVRGLLDAVGYASGTPKPQTPWAGRLHKAHLNAVENLVVFAALVLVAHALGLGAAITTACVAYLWARIVHAAAFTFAIPFVRTLAFFVGFLAQAAIAWQIFTHV